MAQKPVGDFEFEELDPQKLELNQILDKVDICIDAVRKVDDTRVYEGLIQFVNTYVETSIKSTEKANSISDSIIQFQNSLNKTIESGFKTVESDAHNITNEVLEVSKTLENNYYANIKEFERRHDEIEHFISNLNAAVDYKLNNIQESIDKVDTLIKSQLPKYVEVVSFKDIPDINAFEESQKFMVMKSTFFPFKLSGIYKIENVKGKRKYVRL